MANDARKTGSHDVVPKVDDIMAMAIVDVIAMLPEITPLIVMLRGHEFRDANI